MKKILIILTLASAGFVFYIKNHTEKLASILLINDSAVILFEKNCEYSSISLYDQSNKGIETVNYSEHLGDGPVFAANTYLPIGKLFNTKLAYEKYYSIKLTTDCLRFSQTPMYKITFSIKSLTELKQ